MKYYFTIILVFIGFFAKAHPFYVSIATINYNTETSALEVTLKVFTDDLETSIKGLTEKTLNLGFENELKNATDLLEKYCNETFKISVSEKNPIFIGFETEADVTYLFFELENVKPPINLNVSCSFLTETYEDQVTIFNLECGEIKETVYTNKSNLTFSKLLKCE